MSTALALASVVLLALQDPEPAPEPFGPGGWETYTAGSGRFSVEFPGEPEEQVEVQELSGGRLENHFAYINGPEGVYFLVYHELPAGVRAIPTDRLLDDHIDNFAEATENRITDRRTIELDGHAGRAYEFEIPPVVGTEPGRGAARIFRVDDWYIELTVWGTRAIESGDADRFFDSIALLDAEAPPAEAPPPDRPDWVRFDWAEGGVSVLMPGEPEREEIPIRTPNGPKPMHRIEARDEAGRTFSVGVTELDHPIPEANHADAHDRTVRRMAEGTGGLLLSEEDVTVDGHLVRAFSIRMPAPEGTMPKVLRGRLLLDGVRVYDLSVWSPEDQDDPDTAAAFLESLRFLPAEPEPAGVDADAGPEQAETPEGDRR